jgi:fructose-1,6-bisphosphatase I
MTTLIEFINEKQHDFPFATGELTRLLHDIGIAAKIVHREINLAGLTQNMGYEGGENIQGERQKKLDVFANRHFIKALQTGSQVCAIASEENEKIVVFDNPYSKVGKYVVAMDPLDGSSNIEVNIPVGTIFSIYRRKTNQGEPATEEEDATSKPSSSPLNDFLQRASPYLPVPLRGPLASLTDGEYIPMVCPDFVPFDLVACKEN